MTFDFEEHRRNAIAEYQPRQSLFQAFAETVRRILMEALQANNIQAASIEARAKEAESFGTKASKPSESNPEQPRYPDPLSDITDLAGVRVIMFFPKTAESAGEVVRREFNVVVAPHQLRHPQCRRQPLRRAPAHGARYPAPAAAQRPRLSSQRLPRRRAPAAGALAVASDPLRRSLVATALPSLKVLLARGLNGYPKSADVFGGSLQSRRHRSQS